MKHSPRRLRQSCARRTLVLASCFAFVCAACGKKDSVDSAKAEGLRKKWEYKSGGSGMSHPAIGTDGTIYAGTSGAVFAISPAGRILWQTSMGAAGVPVLANDGAIYLDTWHGSVFGLSSTGEIVWKPGYGLIGFGAPPALGPNSTLFFLNTTADIYSFQPKVSDKTIWNIDTFREGILGSTNVLPGSARSDGVASRSAPLLTRASTLIVPRQNFLHSISATGDPGWDLEVTSGHLGQAALAHDGTIYVGDDQSVLYAVDPEGSLKWHFDAGGSVIGSPVIDNDGVVYFTAGPAVYAVNPDGSLKWRYAPQPRIPLTASPVIAADGTLYFGGDFAVIALHHDGTLKASLRDYTPTSSLTIAQDGTIYFACGYSWLCAVEDAGSPLMSSAWPKQFHDLANTSNPLHGEN
jgi:hypothetical protein